MVIVESNIFTRRFLRNRGGRSVPLSWPVSKPKPSHYSRHLHPLHSKEGRTYFVPLRRMRAHTPSAEGPEKRSNGAPGFGMGAGRSFSGLSTLARASLTTFGLSMLVHTPPAEGPGKAYPMEPQFSAWELADHFHRPNRDLPSSSHLHLHLAPEKCSICDSLQIDCVRDIRRQNLLF